MKRFGSFLLFIVSLLLVACADEQAVRMGPQAWHDLQIVVEARPSPVRVGMNEFIVIASREQYKPVVDLIVTIRADEKTDWRQAIQDGYTGVYRRAVRINNPETDVLAVHVRKTKSDNKGAENETILYFPLSQK